jgi:hypothetical protein
MSMTDSGRQTDEGDAVTDASNAYDADTNDCVT